MIKVRESLAEEIEYKKGNTRWFVSVLLIFLVVFLAINVINNYILFNVSVSGESMFPTLSTGDILKVSKLREPKHGDIIIIDGEKIVADGKTEWLVKRAIGLSGDTVDLREGYVYLKKAGEEDFTKIEEPYVIKQGATHPEKGGLEFPYTLGENEVLYLGDNRINSMDSRYDVFRTCEKSQIIGVVPEWSVKMKTFNTKYVNIINTIKRKIGISS